MKKLIKKNFKLKKVKSFKFLKVNGINQKKIYRFLLKKKLKKNKKRKFKIFFFKNNFTYSNYIRKNFINNYKKKFLNYFLYFRIKLIKLKIYQKTIHISFLKLFNKIYKQKNFNILKKNFKLNKFLTLNKNLNFPKKKSLNLKKNLNIIKLKKNSSRIKLNLEDVKLEVKKILQKKKIKRNLLIKKRLSQQKEKKIKLTPRISASDILQCSKDMKILNYNPNTGLNSKHLYLLSITIKRNNFFINLSLFLGNKTFKTIKIWTGGFFDFIYSKKKMKFAIADIIREMHFRLKRLKIYAIKIKASKHLNRHIFRLLKKRRFLSNLVFYPSYKIFNGCKSLKKRRKKRLRFRFFR